jgi:hypothetical protein
MRRAIAVLLTALLFSGCTSLGLSWPVSWTQTAKDAIACAIGISNEVALGVADPAFQALGKSPSPSDIATALTKVQSMLPATIASCAALASDFSLPSNPSPLPVPPATSAGSPAKVGNPWRQ